MSDAQPKRTKRTKRTSSHSAEMRRRTNQSERAEGQGDRPRRRRSRRVEQTEDQSTRPRRAKAQRRSGESRPEKAPSRAARPDRARPDRAPSRKAQADKAPSRKAQASRRRKKASPEQRARARKLSRARQVGVAATALVLGCSAVIGLLFFARPTVSEVEKRTLTQFPALTWGGFWDGSFFSDVALWYSDTYPVREQLVAADQAIANLHGVKSETQMVGGVKQADELPPATDSSSSSSSTKTEEKKEREKVEVPTQEEMAAAVQDQITNGLYVKGDTAYGIYYFSQEATEEYAEAVNATADAMDGQAEVYSMIIPNSSGIMLSDKEVKDLGGTNQVDAINYFYSLYNDKVHAVDSVSKLKNHTDEYLYYRTDHHWTALGAYYAYEAFCEEKGIKPESRDDLEHKEIGTYLGSYYSELNNSDMEANPDIVEAWVPNGTNDLTIIENDGSTSEAKVVDYTTDWPITERTMCFIMGDQALEKISNPKVTDGSSCLIIKDSFADFFVPWLVDHYETVWVADFRYYEGNYTEFVKENDVKDVIIMSSISLAGGGVFGPAVQGRL